MDVIDGACSYQSPKGVCFMINPERGTRVRPCLTKPIATRGLRLVVIKAGPQFVPRSGALIIAYPPKACMNVSFRFSMLSHRNSSLNKGFFCKTFHLKFPFKPFIPLEVPQRPKSRQGEKVGAKVEKKKGANANLVPP